MIDVTVTHGDTFATLKTLESGSIDLIFADPPFNVGIKYLGCTDNRNDYYEWCEAWIGECFRLLKDTGTIYLMTLSRHIPHIAPLMQARGVFINPVIWTHSTAANNKRSYRNGYQPILVYGKSETFKFNVRAQRRPKSSMVLRWGDDYTTEPQGQLLDVWSDIPFIYAGSVKHKEAVITRGTNKKAHPAQMPVALARRAILFSSDEGDTVLDPFAGSFTTAVACIETNRNFIGIEQSDDYVKLGIKRIAHAQAKQPLPIPNL